MVAPAALVLAPAPPAQVALPEPVLEPLVGAAAADGGLYGGKILDGLEATPPSSTVSLLVRLRGDPISNIILDYRGVFGEQAAWAPQTIDGARLAIAERNATLGAQRLSLLASLSAAGIDAQPTRDYRYLVNGINLRDVPAYAVPLLAAHREVVMVERDHEVSVAMAQSVPLLNADDVWNMTDGLGRNITGQGSLIANIDTGVDYSHPDLGGTLNRTNDLANLTAGTHPKFARGWDFVNDDADPWDGHLHGTHVAGTIGANGTIVGIAPNSKQLALKVLSDAGYGGDSDIIAAMEYATDPDQNPLTNDAANASSMSLGGWDPNPDGLEPIAADQSARLGTVCVIAAGNSGATNSVGSPGVSRLSITVGSTTKSDVLSGFSSRGPTLGLDLKPDLVAPGSSINSTRWGGAGGTLILSGTSMATPMVSGAIALLAQAHPNWTVNQTKSALVDTAVDLGYGVFQQGGGRMNILAAVGTPVAATPHKVVMGRLDRLTNGTNATVMLQNMGTSAVTLDLSARDVFGMNPDMTYTNNNTDLNFVATVESNVTIAAGAFANITVRFSPSSSAVPGIYWGTLNVSGPGVSLRIPLTYAVRAPVLLVDDDSSDRWGSAPAFDNFAGFPSATNNMSGSLTRLGFRHDIFTAVHYTDNGPKLADLVQYPLVIWMTGYDYDYSDGYHTHRSISSADRVALASYLDRGGQLWLIGENIAWEVFNHQNATVASSNFFNAYLGVGRVEHELNTPNPLNGTPLTFMGGASYTVNPTWTDYGNNGDYATNLTPTARAFTIFNGSTTDVYGNLYPNASLAVAVDNETYRSVFWGVEFSFLGTNANFDNATARTMQFFAPRPVLLNATPSEGQFLDFRGRYGFLPSESAFTFAWSFGDNSTAATRNATHTYLDDGTYTVRFTVTSGAWLNLTGSIAVTVANLPPNVENYNFSTNVTEGAWAWFTISCDDPGVLDPVDYSWTFEGAWLVPGQDISNERVMVWFDEGTYNGSVTCFDLDFGYTQVNFTVVVGNADPSVGPLIYAGRPFENGTMNFVGNCTDPGAYDVLDYTWSWGDGTPDGVGRNASHVYADDGNYTVTLRCGDQDGGGATNTSLLRVWNVAPSASLAGPSTIQEGALLVLNLTVFDPGVFDTHTYAWNFGDGSPLDARAAAGHSFVDNGVFRITLTVTDNAGDWGVATWNVTVANVAPYATITILGPLEEGAPFAFEAVIVDPGTADTHTLTWAASAGVTPGGAWADEGNYTLQATVMDDDRSGTIYWFNVTILNVAPSVRLEGVTADVLEGEPAPFQANISDPGALDILTVSVDYGDGSPVEDFVVSDWRASPLASFTHKYADEGEYTVAVDVDDGDGGHSSTSFLVRVDNAAPSLAVQAGNLTADEGEVVDFAALAEDPGAADVLTVTWRFGDGSPAQSGALASHAFRQNGLYEVRVTAEDDSGAAAVVFLNVTVRNVAPVISVEGPSELFQQEVGTFTATAIDAGLDDALTVWWQWDDGTSNDTLRASRSFAVVGFETVTVHATDQDGGEAVFVFRFEIENAFPSITGLRTEGPLLEGTPIGFEAAIRNAAGEALLYRWEFGDGETSDLALPTHVYFDEGDFAVRLTVTEPDGVERTLTQSITVGNAPPVVSCGECSARVAEGTALAIRLAATDPGAADSIEFFVVLPSGEVMRSIDGNFEVTFASPGALDLEVGVRDGDGGSDSATFHVVVESDFDGDGSSDAVDPDDDDDGTPDAQDPGPFDPTIRDSGGWPSWVLLLVAAGGVVAVFLARRRRRDGDG